MANPLRQAALALAALLLLPCPLPAQKFDGSPVAWQDRSRGIRLDARLDGFANRRAALLEGRLAETGRLPAGQPQRWQAEDGLGQRELLQRQQEMIQRQQMDRMRRQQELQGRQQGLLQRRQAEQMLRRQEMIQRQQTDQMRWQREMMQRQHSDQMHRQ